MANFYNSVPQGRFVSARNINKPFADSSLNQVAKQEYGSNTSHCIASKEYADATKSLAMAQMRFGNKPLYCTAPINYKNI